MTGDKDNVLPFVRPAPKPEVKVCASCETPIPANLALGIRINACHIIANVGAGPLTITLSCEFDCTGCGARLKLSSTLDEEALRKKP